MFGRYLERVRCASPLVHCITNYVTVMRCADIVLACGGSPIMADSPAEADDIASICGAVVINIGTLNERTIASMLAAGRRAREQGRPVVFDPVGAGASPLRRETSARILTEVRPTIVRGNYSELLALSSVELASRGVDSDPSVEADLHSAVLTFASSAADWGATVAVGGATDVISDGRTTYTVRGGSAMTRRITGAGCMLSCMMGAFAAASPDDALGAAAAAMATMKIAAARAARHVEQAQSGTASFAMRLIDEISMMAPEHLEEGADYERLS